MYREDALRVAEHYAKLFQPWMWNRYKHELTSKGLTSGLLRSIIEQVERALENGWSCDSLKSIISNAYNTKNNIPLWKLIQEEKTKRTRALKSIIVPGEELTHQELIDETGQIKQIYTIEDLKRFYYSQLDAEPSEIKLKEIVQSEGLDLVLYMIDEAHFAAMQVYSVKGLLIFKEQAAARKAQQIYLRRSIEYSMEILSE